MLTESQRKLVEDNMPLTTLMIKKLKYEYNDVNFSNACLGLCKAALMFNPNKGFKFTTYACQCIRAQLALEYRKTNKRTTEKPILSLDYEFENDNDNKAVNFNELVPAKNNVEDEIDIKIIYEDLNNFLSKINPDHKIIFKMYYFDDLTQKEIAEIKKISQAQVSRICKNIIKKFKSEYCY